MKLIKANKSLIKAAKKGDLAGVKKALENGADINYRDPHINSGDTAVGWAATKNRVEILEFLIGKGADIEIADFGGRTPLICAARDNCLEAVKTLVKAGAKLDTQDEYGYTALFHSVQKSRYGITKFLIEKGANIEIVDNKDLPAIAHSEKHYMFEILSNKAKDDTKQEQPKPIYAETYEIINPYMISKFQGYAESLGEVRTLFNFKSRTVTQVIEKVSGPQQAFNEFAEDQRHEIVAAYNVLKTHARDAGHTLEPPFPAKKEAIGLLNKQTNSRT